MEDDDLWKYLLDPDISESQLTVEAREALNNWNITYLGMENVTKSLNYNAHYQDKIRELIKRINLELDYIEHYYKEMIRIKRAFHRQNRGTNTSMDLNIIESNSNQIKSEEQEKDENDLIDQSFDSLKGNNNDFFTCHSNVIISDMEQEITFSNQFSKKEWENLLDLYKEALEANNRIDNQKPWTLSELADLTKAVRQQNQKILLTKAVESVKGDHEKYLAYQSTFNWIKEMDPKEFEINTKEIDWNEIRELF